MQRLTGKRSIKSYEVAPKNKQPSQQNYPAASIPSITANKEIIFKQNSTLTQMIKEQ